MSSNNIHDEWLSLVEVTGPFLAPPVLNEAFPQGLDLLDPGKRKRLRQTYEEWREALDSEDPEFLKIHQAWIKEVISNCLGFNEDSKGTHLKFGDAMPPALVVQIPEQGITLSPEYALVDEQQSNKPLLLVQSYASGVDLQAAMSVDGWSATPADRMIQLCRSTGCRLGLVTDGERWMLIDAPVGAVTTFASWYARLWIQEPITLQAFVHLLGIRRFFVASGEQIPALIDKSLQHQDEVTTALGEQVQRAVEVLIQSLDRADQDRNRELLKDVTPAELYEAGLTVMMRLVFLLSAEERGLLLMGDEAYEKNYSISTLRMQLRSESEEILERRWDAWSRLLSVFRAVYGGIDHENMRLPALGGSLFDPDRFPFLEGRAKGSNWHQESAKPLPIDNRTVLLLLEAIQQYQGRSLSYKALDVEQIGYVYEGLLERTVQRVGSTSFEIQSTKSSDNPLIMLNEISGLSPSDVIKLFQKRSGMSQSRIFNDLQKQVSEVLEDRIATLCQGNIDLLTKIRPYLNIIKVDPWGYPLIYPENSFVVVSGEDRRDTGAHYTPKALTENLVSKTLAPLVYQGASEGVNNNDWKLYSSNVILNLRICDPAMGSGAFLVQTCRWLADRLVESWDLSDQRGEKIGINGLPIDENIKLELLPLDAQEKLILARRLIAERCLYGVDLNPLAVELAKLSIWLITLSKGRPFGFLDHNLRCGDSLLGIKRLPQLTSLNLNPTNTGQQFLFAKNIEDIVSRAVELRGEIRKISVLDIRDVFAISRMYLDTKEILQLPEVIANNFIGNVLESGRDSPDLEASIAKLAINAGKYIDGNASALSELAAVAQRSLSFDLPSNKSPRRPFHWPLEFPEIFTGEDPGFDAVIANPPFLGGKKLTAAFGTAYREYLVNVIANGVKGNADFLAYFVLRTSELVKRSGFIGLVCTNSISEGDTREVGLDGIVSDGRKIVYALVDLKWPGQAALTISILVLAGPDWRGARVLNNVEVEEITQYLKSEVRWSPVKLESNKNWAFQGSILLGTGFAIDELAAESLLSSNVGYRKILYPYIIGRDVNSDPAHKPSRWVINFWDWGEEKASAYTEAFDIVLKHVKPERDAIKSNNSMSKRYKELWWQFGVSVKNLYHTIGRGHNFISHTDDWDPNKPALNKVIVCATGASKFSCFTMVPNDAIYANTLCVIADERYSIFGILSSSIHSIWAWEYGSRLEDRLRYTHGDVFETFPFPENEIIDSDLILASAGEKYLSLRSEYMLKSGIGMTQTYNRFHNRDDLSPDLQGLRLAQVELDLAVIRAYGWSDLNLSHDFCRVPGLPEKDSIRFTISNESRIELLSRLALLNKKLHENELSGGIASVRGVLRSKKATSDLKNTFQDSLDF
jgi:type I restriction-modification system DNA methylase subunit